MFLQFYGLREQPFGATPDPRYLYLSRTHREVIASLIYRIGAGRGFLGLVAQPGMGKTTVLFHLLQQLRGKAKTAFIFQSQCDSQQLLRYLARELELDCDRSDPVQIHEAMTQLLVNEAKIGRDVVVVLDEAQNFSDEVLETVRLLSDFETSRAKLLQIVLSGQPQLGRRITQPNMVQLRQRMSMICRLSPLSPDEVGGYIQHRLAVAGYAGPQLFEPAACGAIARLSEGIPRNVNNICFNCLSLGYTLERKTVTTNIVAEVAQDFDINNLAGMAEEQNETWELPVAALAGARVSTATSMGSRVVEFPGFSKEKTSESVADQHLGTNSAATRTEIKPPDAAAGPEDRRGAESTAVFPGEQAAPQQSPISPLPKQGGEPVVQPAGHAMPAGAAQIANAPYGHDPAELTGIIFQSAAAPAQRVPQPSRPLNRGGAATEARPASGPGRNFTHASATQSATRTANGNSAVPATRRNLQPGRPAAQSAASFGSERRLSGKFLGAAVMVPVLMLGMLWWYRQLTAAPSGTAGAKSAPVFTSAPGVTSPRQPVPDTAANPPQPAPTTSAITPRVPETPTAPAVAGKSNNVDDNKLVKKKSDKRTKAAGLAFRERTKNGGSTRQWFRDADPTVKHIGGTSTTPTTPVPGMRNSQSSSAQPVTVATAAPPSSAQPPTSSPTPAGATERSASRSDPRPQLVPLHIVPPIYPAQARANGLQGVVELQVAVAGTGTVRNVEVLSGDPILANAAMDAVKHWRYKPYSAGSATDEVSTHVTVSFVLPHGT